MLEKLKKLLYPAVAVVIGSYFLFLGLAKSKGFLAPLVMALILSLLMIPLSNWLEKRKFNRPWASFLCTFIIFLASLAFAGLVSLQVKNFAEDWNKIQQRVQPKIEQAEKFIADNTPLSRQKVEEYQPGNDKGQSSPPEGEDKSAISILKKISSFFGNYLLTFVYIFFLLTYRHRFRNFILRLFPDRHRKRVKNVTHETAKVARAYLKGRLLLILFLAVLYSIGLGISGVGNFIIISIISAFLSILPYIGNLLAFVLALGFGYLGQSDTGVLIGVILTFGIVQFVESYVLEPYVVGDKVDLHPFFVILAVVLGNMVWGIMGMILAIPVLGIIHVIFTHIPALQPFGYLLSKDSGKSSGE